MRATRLNWTIAIAWLALLGAYAAVSVWLPQGYNRTAVADVFLCFLPLVVNAALLVNTNATNWKQNGFWMLLALGCTCWLVGQSIRTYLEAYQRVGVSDLFIGDVAEFLHTIPLIAALTMQPNKRSDGRVMMYRYADFGVILCWWVFLYVFAVIPYQYIVADPAQYAHAYNIVTTFENSVFAIGAALLAIRATGRWRVIYAHLAGAGWTYTLGALFVEISGRHRAYAAGSLYILPTVISLVWLGTAGLAAYQGRKEEEPGKVKVPEAGSVEDGEHDSLWTSRMARIALFSVPLIGLWCMRMSDAPRAIHDFRIILTIASVVPLGFLAFLRHELVNTERIRLLRASEEALNNLKRLQMQLVQSEKLASLGQLVAGAAHEINNPLTAILGYSDLLGEEAANEQRVRSLAEKIREQARRTSTLVTNLLSFARQTPAEQHSLIDVNTILNSAAQLRRLDRRNKSLRIELHAGNNLPQVRGDCNQLLQVFFNIISNAMDAMEEVGGGVLTVSTALENGKVAIVFSDTGPGIREPNRVFDPFYTTKPVGKGTGLGLSICYGIIQDQGGQITCFNRPQGGATFRIELPGIPTLYPLRAGMPVAQNKPAKLA
jgi:signal transduction histidine kinase